MLINRTKPLTNESLDGLFERLTVLNYYENHNWYKSYIEDKPFQGLAELRLKKSFHAIQSLTGLDTISLVNLTLHRFTSRFYDEDELSKLPTNSADIDYPVWEHHKLIRFKQNKTIDIICVLCWQEAQTFLLPWKLRLVTTCPKHQVILTDICSNCKQYLIINFSKGSCVHCNFPVGSNPVISITNHLNSEILTHLVWRAIGCEKDSRKDTTFDSMVSGLEDQLHPSIILEFLRAACGFLPTRCPEIIFSEPYLNLTSSERTNLPENPLHQNVQNMHSCLTAACALLINWPTKWYDLLYKISENEKQWQKQGREFRSFPQYLLTTFPGPKWAWLHKGWQDFIQNELSTSFILETWLTQLYLCQERMTTLPTLCTIKKSSEILGVGPVVIHQYLKTGKLKALAFKQSKRLRKTYVLRTDIERLDRDRKTLIPISEAARYCGIKYAYIRQLVEEKFIEMSIKNRYFSVENLSAFIQQILDKALKVEEQDFKQAKWVTLGKVRSMLNYSGIHLSQIILAVCEGSLPAYCLYGSKNLKGLRFSIQEIKQFRADMRMAQHSNTAWDFLDSDDESKDHPNEFVLNLTCLNEKCNTYGKKNLKNIIPLYQAERGVWSYKCLTCESRWSETKGTLFYHLHHSPETILDTFILLSRGCSFADIQRQKGIQRETVMLWLRRSLCHKTTVTNLLEKYQLPEEQIQAFWLRINQILPLIVPEENMI